jgi:hypothetical protein
MANEGEKSREVEQKSSMFPSEFRLVKKWESLAENAAIYAGIGTTIGLGVSLVLFRKFSNCYIPL